MQDFFELYFEHVERACNWLSEKTGNINPVLMIVLTGGIDGLEQRVTDKQEFISSDIPYFPKAHVQGHEGKLIFGKLDGISVVLLKGRFHYYEGHSPQAVVFPYFVLQRMGVKSLITTNAVGGIRTDLSVGDIVMITDHINYLGQNPLRAIAMGKIHDQFTDMTDAYYRAYQEIAKNSALEKNVDLKHGIYVATTGPSYETKAEIKALRTLGADVVGMSLVFEVIACNFLGIKVLAFSVVTNVAADRHCSAMNHDKVIDEISIVAPKLSLFVCACAQKIISYEQKSNLKINK